MALWPDDKDEDSDEKLHSLGFDQASEKLIKKVKQALENDEGCRVLCSRAFLSC